MLPAYHSELQKYSPVYPIIKKKQLHADIVNALKSLIHMEERSSMLVQVYIQMMLAKLRKQNGWSKENLSARLRVSRLNSIRMGIYFFISEIGKKFFELDLFLNILLHIQHIHYKNLLILNINYPLFF